MARCRCATDSCSCVVRGGLGVVVQGIGSSENPFIISVNPAITGTIDFVDSATVNFEVTGSGLQATPYLVTAHSFSAGRYVTIVGNGSSLEYTITHNLGSQDVSVTVYENAAPYSEAQPEVQHLSVTQVKLVFTTAPSASQYRVVVAA